MNYAAKQQSVESALTKYGASVTVTTRGSERYDTDLQTIVRSETTQEVYALIAQYNSSETDGEHIRRGDLKLNLPGTMDPAPAEGDTVTIGSEIWNVQAVETLQPGGIPVMFTIQVRK